MELIMDYKEGNLMNEGNTLYLVLFKTLYNMVIVEFSRNMLTLPYSEWKNNLPIITWKNYSLTNKDDVEQLNIKFTVTQTNNLNKFPIVYNVEIGSIVEFDYKQMMLMGKTERKILSFTLIRPILFDFNKAKEKYIVFDRLGKLNELQNEFDTNLAEYLITPFASEENIDWFVVKNKLPFEELIGKDFIINEFAHTPTELISLEDFYGVIDTKKLEKIPDENIRKEIINLIKQTLVIAKENQSIGTKSEPKKQKKPVVPINEVIDENAGKTLYRINVVVSAMDKDGGTKYPKLYDVYADNQDEALEKIRDQVTKSIKLTDLYYDSDEIIDVIPPTENKPVSEIPIEETENLEDLLALYKIEETENLDDLLKLYE